MCRALLLMAALLASANAFASRQTHELIHCSINLPAQGQPMQCFGTDPSKPVYENVRIQDLYRDGWRLISTVRANTTVYWLERPITPTAE